MYQSIPKRVYTTKESAMPQMQNAFSSQQAVLSKRSELLKPSKTSKLSKLFDKIETDDLLLIGLLLLLLSEEGEHELLTLVVAFLLFF